MKLKIKNYSYINISFEDIIDIYLKSKSFSHLTIIQQRLINDFKFNKMSVINNYSYRGTGISTITNLYLYYKMITVDKCRIFNVAKTLLWENNCKSLYEIDRIVSSKLNTQPYMAKKYSYKILFNNGSEIDHRYDSNIADSLKGYKINILLLESFNLKAYDYYFIDFAVNANIINQSIIISM